MLTKIFEPFIQVDRAAARFYAGLGIGLALAKQLIEMHGGTIEAHSEGAGMGSEFVMKLPAARTAARSRERRADRSTTCSRPTSARPAHKIVVADDVVESATTLAKMLEALGQEVAVAYDGASTIDAVHAPKRPGHRRYRHAGHGWL